MMTPYKSRSPASGVTSYEIIGDTIILEFVGAKHRYVYDSTKPGLVHVQAMIRLAIEGKGLATYVSQHVHSNYAAKITIDKPVV